MAETVSLGTNALDTLTEAAGAAAAAATDLIAEVRCGSISPISNVGKADTPRQLVLAALKVFQLLERSNRHLSLDDRFLMTALERWAERRERRGR